MADYGVKYRFRWSDDQGADWKVDISQDGYTGSVLQRAVGGSSAVLRRDRNGNICGTSLELAAECVVDEEFAELYTTNPYEFKVEVFCNGTSLWLGFITPELYSEPFIAPPYDVQVTASDNLGELKRYKWGAAGRLTLANMLATLLYPTGLSLAQRYVSKMATSSLSASSFFQGVSLDLDELAGETYYDVLDNLLSTLHAVIFQQGGCWVIMRETDITSSISSDSVVPAGELTGYPIGSIGSAYAGGLWPEGHVDLTVEPAHNSISLVCSELWKRYGAVTIDNGQAGNPQNFRNATLTLSATFSASDGISLHEGTNTERFPLSVVVDCAKVFGADKVIDGPFGAYDVFFTVQVAVTGNGVTRYLAASEGNSDAGKYIWKSSRSSINIALDSNTYYRPEAYGVSESTTGEVIAIDLPDCEDITALTRISVTYTGSKTPVPSGIVNYKPAVHFYDAWLSFTNQFDSLMDTVSISNNARGPASDVKVIVSGATNVALEKYFISNTLLVSGALIGQVHSDNFSGYDFISFLSRDYALSIAAPRLRAEGVLFGYNAPVILPLFVSMGGVRYAMETWDWNLVSGGIDFSALSLPAVSVTVTSEEIVTGDGLSNSPSSGGGYSGGGSGGSSSSGGSGYIPSGAFPTMSEWYIGTTKAQPSPTEDQDLTGIGNATLSGKLNLPQGAYLEVVNVGTTANPVYAIHTNIGLYSDGFISAFGASDTGGGGGGGGIDLSAMWTNLQINESGVTGYGLQIDYHHLPTIAYNGDSGFVTSAAWSKTGSTNYLTLIRRALTASDIPSLTTSKISDLETWINGKDFLTGNETITLSGVVSGSGTTAITTSIADGKITNAMLAGSIANGKLANSAITINGSSTALGGSFATADITAGTAGTSSATSGLSIAIPYVTLNQYGIVTAYGAHTHSISKANITSAIGSTTYAPYNSAGYLPLNGGVMTGPISGVTYLSVNRAAQTTYRLDVNGATRLAGNTSVTGTLGVTGATTLANLTVGSSNSITLGEGVLTWDAQNSAWKLTGNLYATGFISAFGASDTGGGGGGGNVLAAMWANLQVNESGTTGYNLQINPGHLTTALGTYVNAITTTGSGNAITAVSKSGSTLTFTKGSTFALASRTVTGTGYLTGGGALSANRTIDIASTYKGYIDEGHTAYGWGDHAQAGYLTGITSSMVTTALGFTPANSTALGNYLPLAGGQMTGPLTWKNSTALPESTAANFFLVIDSFANGGTTKWVSLANVKTSLGLSNYLPLSGGTLTGNLTAPKFIKSGGTASQFLKADGSVDSSVYLTTATAANTYLPLSGGTMTGSPVLGNGINIQANDSGGTARTIMGLNSSNVLHIGYLTAGQGYITRIYGGDIEFHYGTGMATGMTLTSGGNVGIGTTSPSYKLDVTGSIRATERVVATTGFGTIASPNSANVASPGWYRIWSSDVKDINGNNIILFINSSYNRSAPENFAFEINIEGNGAISITQLSGNRQSTAQNLTKLRVVWAYNTANSVFIDFYYAGSVSNPIRVHGYAGKGQFQPAAAVTNTPAHAVEFDLLQNAFKTSKNIAAMGTIHSTVGIYSDGYVSAYGQSTTSDARLKKDFLDTTLTVDDIAHAPAITFLWKDREGKRQAGSLAQYWETVLPEVVTDIEGKKGLDYGAAALVSAITIARDVNDHEKRIRELERENRELKRRLGYADR